MINTHTNLESFIEYSDECLKQWKLISDQLDAPLNHIEVLRVFTQMLDMAVPYMEKSFNVYNCLRDAVNESLPMLEITAQIMSSKGEYCLSFILLFF
jgi:hypothetical protein